MKSVNDVSCCLSHEEAKAKRMFSMMQFSPRHRCDFGSLWWVDESVWKENVQGYDQQSNRDSHPGLSILREVLATPFEKVPMLYGGSKKGGQGVRVKMGSSEASRTTCFGKICTPVFLGLDLFFASVNPNKKKSHVNDEENDRLVAWLEEKGLACKIN